MIIAKRLRTEYLYEPVGIDITSPRFFWNCEWDGSAEDPEQQAEHRQTAYQIVAQKDGKTVWDSGQVCSESMTHVPYEGPKLCSRDRISWKVRLWDEKEEAGEFAESFFEMGLLKAEDWQAKWISGDYEPQKNTRYPVDCFAKSFAAGSGCMRARLYISACGLYEARLNGKKAGDACFTPGCTDYRKRIPYQVYDVTELIQEGKENLLEVELADGWYRGCVNAYGQTEVYGTQTKLLCQLELFYQDGTEERIVSDGSFLWSDDGPLRFADFKDGEVFDANLKPSYRGRAREITDAALCAQSSGSTEEAMVPISSNQVPVREKELFSARPLHSPSGKLILDFGQNLAGYVDVCIKGEKDQKISIWIVNCRQGYGRQLPPISHDKRMNRNATEDN